MLVSGETEDKLDMFIIIVHATSSERMSWLPNINYAMSLYYACTQQFQSRYVQLQ